MESGQEELFVVNRLDRLLADLAPLVAAVHR